MFSEDPILQRAFELIKSHPNVIHVCISLETSTHFSTLLGGPTDESFFEKVYEKPASSVED